MNSLAGSANACISNQQYGTLGGGYQYSYPQITYVAAPAAEVEIRSVANGFILKHSGQEFVFQKIEQLSAWLEKHYSTKLKTDK